MNPIGILGASRGLGASLAKCIEKESPETELLLLSRTHGVDFADESQYSQILERLEQAQLSKIFYVAGGGPYGSYSSKEWKDHQWALRLNFEFPAMLLHYFLQKPGKLTQLVFVGSSVAEDKPDPGAASYAAAKHGLKGLIDSVIAEKPALDVRLYSPGYMDTKLLPQNAWPRQQGLAEDPHDVARRLWQWSQSKVKCGTFQEATNVRSES